MNLNFKGQSLMVIKRCEFLNIGDVVYCIEDCSERRVFRVWSRKLIFGVNEVIMPYARRECFKIV